MLWLLTSLLPFFHSSSFLFRVRFLKDLDLDRDFECWTSRCGRLERGTVCQSLSCVLPSRTFIQSRSLLQVQGKPQSVSFRDRSSNSSVISPSLLHPALYWWGFTSKRAIGGQVNEFEFANRNPGHRYLSSRIGLLRETPTERGVERESSPLRVSGLWTWRTIPRSTQRSLTIWLLFIYMNLKILVNGGSW